MIEINAAQLDEKNPVVAIDDGGMTVAPTDNGIAYYVDLPVKVDGEGIKSVTYSVEKDAIAIHCRKDNNPVLDGEVIADNLDTLFDIKYIEDDMKLLDDAMDKYNTDSAEEIMSRYDGKKYSSVTIDYANQRPEGFTLGITGSNLEIGAHKDEILNTKKDDNSLNTQAEWTEKLISNTVICTVKYGDGREERRSIKIGATVSDFSVANEKDFSNLSDEEKEQKNYRDVFVTFSIS